MKQIKVISSHQKVLFQTKIALKKVIEEKYGGKWQVVIGKDMSVYFDESVINDYIILQT